MPHLIPKTKKILLPLVVLLLCLITNASPTIHSWAGTWTQSTSTGITGNCIYRGTTSGGPYTQLFCSTTPITTYTDLTVVGGTTYYYVVTAKAGTEESGYSNEVQAVIPQSPNTPSGLTEVVQ